MNVIDDYMLENLLDDLKRIDVRIRTTKEGYEVMKNFVEKYIKENVSEDAQGLDWNLLNSAEITETGNSITLDWENIKWYNGIDGYQDVDAIMKSLDELSDKDIDYQYMRIGEENNDIDEIWNINNHSFDSFYVSRNYFIG